MVAKVVTMVGLGGEDGEGKGRGDVVSGSEGLSQLASASAP